MLKSGERVSVTRQISVGCSRCWGCGSCEVQSVRQSSRTNIGGGDGDNFFTNVSSSCFRKPQSPAELFPRVRLHDSRSLSKFAETLTAKGPKWQNRLQTRTNVRRSSRRQCSIRKPIGGQFTLLQPLRARVPFSFAKTHRSRPNSRAFTTTLAYPQTTITIGGERRRNALSNEGMILSLGLACAERFRHKIRKRCTTLPWRSIPPFRFVSPARRI